MANHKRGKARNQRAGCKRCKHWKINGYRTERLEGEKYTDHVRRVVATKAVKDAFFAQASGAHAS